LSKFVENLKKNYRANNYIIVKENTKHGNPHFHCIIDMPFINFKILNNSWCIACRSVMSFSCNALTSGNKKIIDNIKGISKYITKYITKADKELSETKKYFISHSCLSQPRKISESEYIYLTSFFGLKKLKIDNKDTFCIVKDYCTFLFLKNFAYLPEMFEIKIKKRQKIPKKSKIQPDYIQPNIGFYSN
jgi:hypothetical protein